MKNILIEAYSCLNLGDDLFIKILTERYKKNNFYLFTSSDYKNFNQEDNLNILKYSFREKIMNKLFSTLKISPNKIKNEFSKKIDGVVEIGGSLFIENKFYKKSLEKRKELLKKNKYFVLGSNFGPYYTENYKNEYEVFFQRCEDISFREQFSYNIFNKLKNVRMAKDIVFSLNDSKSNEEKYILYSVIKPSLRKELRDKDEEYYTQIIKTSIDLIKEGKKIKYMSFCKREGDEEAIDLIVKALPKEYLNKISIYNYSGNLDEALNVIKKSEIIIATRFHAMILGFIYEKQVLPIAYSKKTVNVLKDLNFDGEYIEFNQLVKLNSKIILESKKLNKLELKKAKEDALRHFEKLDIYLNSDKNEE